MSTVVEYELEQIERANGARRRPVVFAHGLWLLQSSWDRWIERFEEAGYAALAPVWPDDPETVADANAHPEDFAQRRIGQVCDHHETIVRRLEKKPAIVGHSFGAFITEMLASRGLSASSVAISPAPFLGVLSLPFTTLKSERRMASNSANRNRSAPLTFDDFRYAFASAISEQEAKQLYESFAVAGPGATPFQVATAGLNPWSKAKVDQNPDRGPLLVISGELDRAVPVAVSKAAYEIEAGNPGSVTQYAEMPGRGHSLTIDHGWSEVADRALAFVQRFASAAVRT
jgi:non-heme chloroperoxidase